MHTLYIYIHIVYIYIYIYTLYIYTHSVYIYTYYIYIYTHCIYIYTHSVYIYTYYIYMYIYICIYIWAINYDKSLNYMAVNQLVQASFCGQDRGLARNRIVNFCTDTQHLCQGSPP